MQGSVVLIVVVIIIALVAVFLWYDPLVLRQTVGKLHGDAVGFLRRWTSYKSHAVLVVRSGSTELAAIVDDTVVLTVDRFGFVTSAKVVPAFNTVNHGGIVLWA